MVYEDDRAGNSAADFVETVTRTCTSTLTPEHRKHLEKEGFCDGEIDQLIALGVRSLSAPEAVKAGFYVSLGQGKKDFSAGLYFPFTDDFGQIRCDRPLTRPGKKPAKYLTQVGKKSQAWLPDGCVAITEGFKDGARSTLMGVPVGAMAGVSHYKKALAQGAGYTLIFDSDGWGNAQVFSNLFNAGLWLRGRVNLLPPIAGEPKGGMCEWVKSGATAADIQSLIDNAYTPLALLMEWPNHWEGLAPVQLLRCVRAAIALAAAHLKEDERQLLLTQIAANCPLGKQQLKDMLKWASQRQAKRAPAAKKTSTSSRELPSHESCRAKLFKKVRAAWGRRLQFNELSKDIELDGEPIDLDKAINDIALEHDLDIPENKFGSIVYSVSKESSYHPVLNYLDDCHARYGDSTSILDNIADRYFGVKTEVAQAMVKRFLISAVARIYEPGCKAEHSLILQGKQGYMKSTWFKVLASTDWFDDSMGDRSDKDERLKLHQTWIVEWAELEGVFKRKDVNYTKGFLSTTVDVLRPPYGKSNVRMKRGSVIVGTSNDDDFLSDATGNRRFWIVPVVKRIPIDLLRSERDQIWAAAVALYKAGEQWHPTALEEQAAANVARNFESADTWAEAIETYLLGQRDYTNPRHDNWPTAPLEQVTAAELLEKAVGVPLAFQKKGDQVRVTNLLKQLGWQKTQARSSDTRRYIWVPTPAVGQGLADGVGNASSPCPPVDTDSLCQPTNPKEVKLEFDDLTPKNHQGRGQWVDEEISNSSLGQNSGWQVGTQVAAGSPHNNLSPCQPAIPTPPPLATGDTVKKKQGTGWVGEIKAMDGDRHALIHWDADPEGATSRVALVDLARFTRA